jgi:hypothetical protein
MRFAVYKSFHTAAVGEKLQKHDDKNGRMIEAILERTLEHQWRGRLRMKLMWLRTKSPIQSSRRNSESGQHACPTSIWQTGRRVQSPSFEARWIEAPEVHGTMRN